MRFLLRDSDNNPSAIIYAADENKALDLWVAEFPDGSECRGVEDITDLPIFGEAGVHDREVNG